MAKSEQSAGMCPAGVWGETPPTGVKIRVSKAIGKNIKNYSSNIKNLSPMSIHFSTFAIEKIKKKPQKPKVYDKRIPQLLAAG